MRYDSEHKARTRERVLREAAAAIRADGPDRLGVAAVMARAGLTHGGFYAHFPSKDALIAATIDHMFADGTATFFADDKASDPAEALQRYVDWYLSMRHRDSADRGCPVPVLAGDINRMPEAARERFAAAVVRMQDRIAGLLGRMGLDDPAGRATSAVAEMVGAVALARVTIDRKAAETLLGRAARSVRNKLGIGDAAHGD